jgi:HEAT repeat protein
MVDISSLINDLFSGDDDRAETAAQQISELGKSAITPLLEKLDASDPDHRWWAVRALACIDQPEAKAAIRSALTDKDSSVRQCAALSLRESPSPAAIPQLIELLEDDDRLLARLAADALVATGDPVVAALIEVMQSPNSGVRIEAARALAIMRNDQAISSLFSALDDPSPWVAYWAEEGLRNMGMEMLFFNL